MPRRPPLRLALLLALLAIAPARAETVTVTSTAALASAIAAAKPGDEIVLADGTYEIARHIAVQASGTAQAPITVRAEHRWKAQIRSSGQMAFEVSAPYWTFRDLDIRGVCADDSTCEHAFHVVGPAVGFRMIGNRIADFNAQLKVNALGGVLPTGGVVEDNELFDTHPRHTGNPVTPLDIDAGSGWVVRRNFIYDFHKDGGNGVSYGAFVKGGAERPVFERNLVICALHDVRGGARVGLSFGGGGMPPETCAPAFRADVPCDHQVTGGVMRNNIVADCSDVGIYLNDATDTQVLFNTLIRTKGVDFRFPHSSGEARGNLMASEIRARDGGQFKDGGNVMHVLSGDFERLYRDPDSGDLRLKGSPALVAGKGGSDPRVSDDFCGRKRAAPLDAGALQSSLGDCPTLP